MLRATERKPDASLVEYGNYPSPFESGNLQGCYQRGSRCTVAPVVWLKMPGRWPGGFFGEFPNNFGGSTQKLGSLTLIFGRLPGLVWAVSKEIGRLLENQFATGAPNYR